MAAPALVAAVLALTPLVGSAEWNVIAAPVKAAFGHGEPVVIALTLENRSDNDESVMFTGDVDSSLSVRLAIGDAASDGRDHERSRTGAGGFEGVEPPVRVRPHASYACTFILDRFVGPLGEGDYTITVTMHNVKATSQPFAVHVVRSIAEECAIWWKIAGNRAGGLTERKKNGLLISLVRDPSAALYQEQLILDYIDLDSELFGNCVESMIATRDPQSIDWIVRTLTTGKDARLLSQREWVTRALTKAGFDPSASR